MKNSYRNHFKGKPRNLKRFLSGISREIETFGCLRPLYFTFLENEMIAELFSVMHVSSDHTPQLRHFSFKSFTLLLPSITLLFKLPSQLNRSLQNDHLLNYLLMHRGPRDN